MWFGYRFENAISQILAMGRMESANRPALKRTLQDLDKDEDMECKDGEISLHYTQHRLFKCSLHSRLL